MVVRRKANLMSHILRQNWIYIRDKTFLIDAGSFNKGDRKEKTLPSGSHLIVTRDEEGEFRFKYGNKSGKLTPGKTVDLGSGRAIRLRGKVQEANPDGKNQKD